MSILLVARQIPAFITYWGFWLITWGPTGAFQEAIFYGFFGNYASHKANKNGVEILPKKSMGAKPPETIGENQTWAFTAINLQWILKTPGK